MTVRIWASAAVSLIALLAALLLWSVGPASECSTPQGLDWLTGLTLFVVFAASGAYVIAFGDRRQRLVQFIASSLFIVGYFGVLAQSLPSVFATEIACAAQGQRPTG